MVTHELVSKQIKGPGRIWKALLPVSFSGTKCCLPGATRPSRGIAALLQHAAGSTLRSDLQSMVGPPHRFKQPGRDIQQTWSSSEDAWLQQHSDECQADSPETEPQPQHDNSLSESVGEDSAQPAWLHRLKKQQL